MDKLENQINDVKEKALPAIDSVHKVVDSVNNVVVSVNNIVSIVEENTRVITTTVEKIDGAVDDIIKFEKDLQHRVEVPVMETLNSYSALRTGIKAFFSKLKEKRSHEYNGGKKYYYEDPDEMLYITQSESDRIQREKYDRDNQELDDINKELDLVRRKLEEMRKD